MWGEKHANSTNVLEQYVKNRKKVTCRRLVVGPHLPDDGDVPGGYVETVGPGDELSDDDGHPVPM